MMPNRQAVLALALLLGGCGTYVGTSENGPDPNPDGGGPGPTASSCGELFTQSVKPRLEFCRNCHIPGGIADKDGGNLFMLSPDGASDADALKASWLQLKDASPAGATSRILTMASGTDARKHSGGAPWPVGSKAYAAMAAYLAGFDDPAACVDGEPATAELDLLGSSHAVHRWASFCQGKPDDAALPADPRTLVQRGNSLNENRAVFFNAYWEDCHVNAPAAEKQATTCGEFRARAARGKQFLMDELPTGATASTAYNDSYKKWGLAARPDNFDELYTLRYGLNKAPFDNPYPKPGEETQLTKDFGGTGQLPLGLRQTRDADGKYTGKIASGACFACHGGNYGGLAEENLGLGNNNYDVPMAGQDGSPFAGSPLSAYTPGFDINSLFNIGIKQRGQNNAVGAFELLMTALDVDSLGVNPQLQKTFFGGALAASPADVDHPIAHTQDTPAWWNYGHRPRKFFDAGVSSDSTRIIMAAGATSELFTGIDGKGYRDRIEKYDQDLEAFFLTLRSPAYPGPIDEALAKQGAVLFHSKDLWANTTDSSKPDYNKPESKPLGGNGSCASCHGAYSPRYVNDPAYLATPDLEGVAGHIEPLAVINTDPARSDMLTKTLRWGWDLTYWAYPEGQTLVMNGVEVAKYRPPYQQPNPADPATWVPTDPNSKSYAEELADDNDPLRPIGACTWEKEVIGYQAPPLYGTWATAPYFHNGSVPTIEAVLNSKLRSPIWQRQLQTVSGVTGFDQRLDPQSPADSAYDFAALGWKSTALQCTDIPGTEQMNCSPTGDNGPSITQVMTQILGGSWTGAVPIPDPDGHAIDKRLVYDTRILGNKNTGHEFSDVLTDQERAAIIEYLKTL